MSSKVNTAVHDCSRIVHNQHSLLLLIGRVVHVLVDQLPGAPNNPGIQSVGQNRDETCKLGAKFIVAPVSQIQSNVQTQTVFVQAVGYNVYMD